MELPPDLVSGTSVTAMFGAALVFIAQVVKALLDRRASPSGRMTDWSTVNVRLDEENKGLLKRIRAEQDRNDELQDRNDELQRQIDDEREAHRIELAELREQLDAMTAKQRELSARLAAAEERYRRDVS